jgi:hypothetical protein
MSKQWLNLYLKFSSFIFDSKQKIVKADSWVVALPYALIVIVFELGFAVVSLPMYLLVSPAQVTERGFIFPLADKKQQTVKLYQIRRKVSVATFLGAGGLWLVKLLLVGLISLSLLGGRILLAVSQDWNFTTASEYTYDSAKIEFTGTTARLKNLGSTTSGNTTNPDFTTNITGWTYADWDQNGGEVNVAGSRITTGGNPGPYAQITFPAGANDELGGYYYQAFTTTVANPTVSLDFDRFVSAYDSTPVPIAFKFYVFVDTASTAPTIGNEVFASSTITSTQAWATTTNLDVSSKVTTAGVYYLKVAVWLETGATGGPYTIGYDNIFLDWTKTTTSYASDSPTIVPTTSLNPVNVSHWDTFAETSTLNGGSINYQLSDDDGATWKFWNGSAWANVVGATDYNSATVVNTNITTFPTTTKKIMWKAFLISNGTQQVILDNINITYTENDLPDVLNLSASQNTTAGDVYITYNLQDGESDASSLATYKYSTTGAFAGEEVTMTAKTADTNHNGISALTTSPSGVAHTFVWNAMADLGAIYDGTVYVRLQGNDGAGNGATADSTAFAVDLVVPVVSTVSALQTAGSTDVVFTYTLVDDTTIDNLVELDISQDSGATWTVTDTSLTGAGAGQTTGVAKTITWSAGTDFDEQAQADLRVRIRAKDKYQNQGVDTASADFALDTLNPAVLATSNLEAQPNAGDTTVLISGTFTESNPNTNDFKVAINGGALSSATTGDANTATPSNQITAVGATLDGNDYISQVQVVHTDDFGQIVNNTNSTPTTAFKYVKPYTPQAPTVANPITTVLDLTINPHTSETAGLEYAINETSTGKYVQADGTLGVGIVWQVLGTSAGQWGNNTGVNAKVNVNGLTSSVANYIFQVKSRNTSDGANASSSESAYSATAQITNTAPSISLGSIGQTTDGTQYVTVNYTGTDGQGDINSLTVYEYSQDNSAWSTMTEKSGVGSDGLTNLTYLSAGSAHDFMWNSGADLATVEDDTVYVRLRSSDTLATSNLATSTALAVDHKAPVISALTASQNSGARTVAIGYTLTDNNNSTVEIDISNDSGATWTVVDTSVSGSVGAGISSGLGKTITWNAGADFDNQYQTDMQVRVRATDTFGNVGSYLSSIDFTVDTSDPVIANVTAVQDAGVDTFTFNYDVSEDAGTTTVGLEISSNSGSTWVVPTTSAGGHLGAGIVSATGKTITWNGVTDYNNQEKTTMKIRVTATDGYSNAGLNSSAVFDLDTFAPRVTSVGAVQTAGSTDVSITYTLADQNNSLIEIDLSQDSGSTWTVTDSSATEHIGSGVVAGSKTITWPAGTDFDEQAQADMRVRVRAKDTFNHQGTDVESVDFALDTLNPTTLTTADLQSQPNAGDTTALIGGSFTETNPNTNNFYLAINGGAYGSATAGSTNTASPSNQATAVGATLDGNDYISKVKIVHTDDFGQSVDNENLAPLVGNKYVKPYTPAVPTVDNPTVGTVDVLINKNSSETDGLEYAIYEMSTTKYVQANGTLGASAVWQTLGTGAGQWGETSAVSGKITVNGLLTHSYLHTFQVKSRNTSDTLNALASESALSTGASSSNQTPVVVLGSIGQTTDGSKYVTINYTGSDLESETSSLATYQYSLNNTTWQTLTEKSGVGSDGISSLPFVYTGTAHDLMWDVNTDLPTTEDGTVYARLQANDGNNNGSIATSSSFIVDTKNPVITTPTASQVLGSNNVTINYTLTDLSNSNVELNISDDGGSTWVVTDTSVSGDVNTSVTPGSGKTVTWLAGTDFDAQEQSDLQVQLRGLDVFSNQGIYYSTANFSLDTKNPVVSNVSAAQGAGGTSVSIFYDLSDTNNSTVAIDISDDNGATWVVTDSSATGQIGSGIAPATGKLITWNAGADFSGQDQADVQVRVRALDIYDNNSGDVASANFSVDTAGPVVSTVSASQTAGSTNVVFTYNLTDSTPASVELDISQDSGSTWAVVDTSSAGDVGAGITQGSGKSVMWSAGSDFDEQQQSDLRVRFRGADTFTNQGAYESSADFALDTLNPTVNTTADLTAQPNAGATTATIGGSFTETNPNTNNFYLAINGGVYTSATAGSTNTASPSNQATAVGATLDGNDYISKIKISHTDDFGQSVDNENVGPNVGYKYIKPYTPAVPTVNNPQNTTVDVTVVKHASEVAGLEYAIYESSQNKYVQANGTLGVSAVWQAVGIGVGEWGESSGISGKITVSGLTSPVANYIFQTKSRNSSDSLNASSSESALSSAGQISNTAPSMVINSTAQQTGGVNYVAIGYTGTDAQNDTNNLSVFEYSTDNSAWSAMTEKSGVGSDGTSGLIFSSTGTTYDFMWDAGTDLPSIEDSTVYVRLRSTDTLANSNLATSSAFAIDNTGPTVSNILVSQTASTKTLVFTYDLTDNSGSGLTVALDISQDSGATWTVTDTSVSGSVGAGQTTGVGKTISWNAGVDFDNQEQSDMRVRIRGIDTYGNAGANASSSDFTVDTKAPTVSNVSASQTASTNNVVISYDLSDISTGGHNVEIDISQDSGATWTVTDTSVAGNVGTGQSTGTAKSITWSAGTDFDEQDQSDIRVRIRSTDYYGNLSSNTQSADFSLDTKNPVITNVSAVQNSGSTNVIISYDLADTNNSNIELDISDDAGVTWTVADTSVSGAIGTGISAGTGKTITWLADTDFNLQYQTDMRVRIRGNDTFNNQSGNTSSSNFTLDTADPVIANIAPVQNSGSTNVVISYDLSDDTADNLTVEMDISDDGGATWTVVDTSVSGDIGSAVATGTSKTITWLAGTDFDGQYQTDMRVRLRATDKYTNVGSVYQSANFTLDTTDPVVSNVSASQLSNTKNINISYDLADDTSTNLSVIIDISEDGGATWTVTDTSVTGNIGASQTTGTSKTITWDAGADFNNQDQNDLRVRVRAQDKFTNQSAYVQSANFSLDTADAVVANVSAVQNIGSTNVIITYDLTDSNSSTVELDISQDSGATWIVTDTSVSGNVGTGVSAGTGKTITWNADNDFDNQFQNDIRVRVRATDSFNNQGAYTESADFTLDTANPVVSNVSASQTSGSTNVVISYDLADDNTTGLSVELDISQDSGSTWTVADTAVTGNVGSPQTTGTGKSITWNAGTDFDEQQQSDIQIRVRGIDKFTNQGAYTASADFALDTKNPTTNITADLQAQPNAGDTTSLIGGSFTETNPDLNNFSIAINGGAYGSATAGSTNTASPSNQATTIGATLDGNDYISKVKITHTDDFGQSSTNENSSPSTTYKYVKPYTPTAPMIDNATTSTVDVLINPNLSEASGLEYAIYETSTAKFVQADGSLNTTTVWQTLGISAGKWGEVSSISGKITITGLSSPLSQYFFQVKSRNISDTLNAVSSESSLSASGSTGNFAPVITLGVIAQTTDGSKYVTINYTGTDPENHASTLATYQYSVDNSTWNTMTEKSGVGSDDTSGLMFTGAGTAHDFMWDVNTDLANIEDTTVYIRLKANDGASDGNLAVSSAFAIDTKSPVVASSSAVQTLASTSVAITYSLTDGNSSTIELDLSEDSGVTWLVTDTAVSGDIGVGVSAGGSKAITWLAGTDFNDQDQNDLQARIRGTDSFGNVGSYNESVDFALDTKNPAVNVSADLQSQPNAGDTTSLIGGSFTETNPNNNDFYLAINGGAYGSVTAGSTNTASPSNQATAVGVTLDGNDYISKVKIVHTDDYAQNITNENSSPAVTYKYVKPYTPSAPTVSNPQNTTVDLVVNKNVSEVGGLEYAIYESSTSQYVQASGTLGASAVWQTITTWGTKTITGLSSPVSQYSFQTKSRNSSDALNASSSESALSSAGSISNTAPSIVLGSIAQEVAGNYVVINYTGTDAQNNTNSLTVYEYSTDNSAWSTMTEKTGVGSDGLTGLIFSSTGTAHDFAWDSSTDLSGVEDTTVYIRLRSSDTLITSSLATSSAFAVDNAGAVVASVTAVQTIATKTVVFAYDLTDNSTTGLNVELDISEDAGSTWTVTDTSVTGNIGSGQTTGTSKTISWDAGTDFNLQEQTDLRVRIRAVDSYGNTGNYTSSSNFTIDTNKPTLSSLSVSQTSGTNNVLITYNLTDQTSSGLTTELDISANGGSTWVVSDTSVTGNIGSGQTTGTSKTITWDAGTDFDGQYVANMKVRMRATDAYGSQNDYTSSENFALDTKDPVVSNVSAVQNVGSTDIVISYDLTENNSSTVELDISQDSGATWTVTDTSVSGNVGSGVSAGTSKTITWNADTDFDNQFQSDIRVRVRALDSFNNQGSYAESADFTLDTANPVVSNVSASQTAGSTSVVITYDLADDNTTGLSVELDISQDSGATWAVTDTSVTGNVGATQTTGTGKSITWNAGTDFDEQQQADIRVRVRGIDKFTNQGAYSSSTDFTLDTLNPATSTTADLQAQPNAGDTTALIGGSFTETSPDLNNFSIAINGGAYGSATAGSTNTATPANQATSVGATLDGNDYISKVKITHTDDFGQSSTNENSSPSTTYKYVKPYTPDAPSVDNPQTSSVDVTINKNSLEITGLEYAIYENTTGKYVQADGTLDTTAVWQIAGTSAGQWGATSGTSAKITVTGLSSPVSQYYFQTKSRNSSDTLHASSSESTLSSATSTSNSAPVITLDGIAQTTDATKYVIINYSAVDAQNNISNLVAYEYSTDNIAWNTMTQKSGVGSSGVSTLAFSSTGASLNFAWDVNDDLANTEDATVYIRLKANDGTVDGNLATSSAFSIDTKTPVIASVSASQITNTSTVSFSYNLTDLENSTIALDISQDSGATWTVVDTSVTGAVGAGVSAGTGKTIIWNAGTDFSGQSQTDMRVRLSAVDAFGNQSGFIQSADFSLDTLSPVVSNLTVAQTANSNNVAINYDLADGTGSIAVELEISQDGGATWTVNDTSATGSVGSGLSVGTGKTITWNAGTDFNGQSQNDMQVRIRAIDTWNNQSAYLTSTDFVLDTASPLISNITISQITGSTNVSASYDLTETSNSSVEIDISQDSGATWTVVDTTVSGDLGATIAGGIGKTITWNAGVDFNNQAQSDMRIRLRAVDTFNNQSGNVESLDFTVDTAVPVLSNITASQNSSGSIVTITYDLDSSATISLDISEDGGTTWSVAHTSATGALGATTAGTGKTITWNVGTDFASQEQSDIRVRLQGIDSFQNSSSYLSSVDFIVDTKQPTGLTTLTKFAGTSSEVTLNWSAGITDTNFDHYEIWSGSQADVQGRSGGAVKWDDTDDLNLSSINAISTVITGLSMTTNQYAKIWAVDSYGNEATVGDVQIFEAVVIPTPTVSGGGASVLPQFLNPDLTPPARPILNNISSPTRLTNLTISGLAEPLAFVSLYDNNVLVGRLNSLADNSGQFSQQFILTEGSYILIVKATDLAGNTSIDSEALNIIIDLTAPSQPLIISPIDKSNISEETPTIVGISEASAIINIILDEINNFQTTADEAGVWNFILPSNFALKEGTHQLSVNAVDQAGNASSQTVLSLNKFISTEAVDERGSTPSQGVEPLGGVGATGTTGGAGGAGGSLIDRIKDLLTPSFLLPPAEIVPSKPIPSTIEIREVAQAVELPGVPVPKILNATIPTAVASETFRFSGTALPNKDVIVYIHSQQAVIYKTRTDASGVWNIDHSQNIIELEPGEHTIFAVMVDPTAKVKSRPSGVSTFTVEKNFWANLYYLLNIQTTLIALAIILATMIWLYRIKMKTKSLKGGKV